MVDSATALSYPSPMDPIEASAPASTRRCVKAKLVYWLPASECAIRPLGTGWPWWSRAQSAISSVSSTSGGFIVVSAFQPTMRRENTSIVNATYTVPDHAPHLAADSAYTTIPDGQSTRAPDLVDRDFQALPGHQPLHRAASDLDVFPCQLPPHLACSIHAEVLLVHL